MSAPFHLKDCNLALISTGEVAESLTDLKDVIQHIPVSSLYYHFWSGRLRVTFTHPEYHNDFARWAHEGLRDDVLSERLTIIDPTEYKSIEELRKVVIDAIEERMEEIPNMEWSRKEDKFHFLRSIIIVYDLGLTVNTPADLKALVPKLPITSIFYHFIDSRRRTEEGSDDFSLWLKSFNGQYEELMHKIKLIDPYFSSLAEIRQKLVEIFNEHL